jgi:hypothetical protein
VNKHLSAPAVLAPDKGPQHPLNIRRGEYQGRYGHFGTDKSLAHAKGKIGNLMLLLGAVSLGIVYLTHISCCFLCKLRKRRGYLLYKSSNGTNILCIVTYMFNPINKISFI